MENKTTIRKIQDNPELMAQLESAFQDVATNLKDDRFGKDYRELTLKIKFQPHADSADITTETTVSTKLASKMKTIKILDLDQGLLFPVKEV